MPVTIKWGSHLHLYLVYSKSETTCLPKRNIAAVLMALVLQPATFNGHAPTTMILTRHSFPFLQRIVLRSLFLWKVVPTLYIWAKLQPMTAWYILSKRSVVGCKALPSRALWCEVWLKQTSSGDLILGLLVSPPYHASFMPFSWEQSSNQSLE